MSQNTYPNTTPAFKQGLLTGDYSKDAKILHIMALAWPDNTIGQMIESKKSRERRQDVRNY